MKTLTFSLPLALMLVVSGCATGGSAGDTGEGPTVAVRVVNNVAPGRNAAIWLVSDSGFRTSLGTVLPNSVRLLETDRIRSLGRYSLVAERTGGRDIISRTFHLSRRTGTIEWDLRRNVVTVVDN